MCDPESFRCYCQSPFTGMIWVCWVLHVYLIPTFIPIPILISIPMPGGDCSLSTCPSGRSWFSYPTADEEAHMAYTVCSDMGTCDQLTGMVWSK
ncbi:hypothetical protein EON63_15040 [archaeon]|nr:MAG: hypothetical protein EON63_15040 [archaeon]